LPGLLLFSAISYPGSLKETLLALTYLLAMPVWSKVGFDPSRLGTEQIVLSTLYYRVAQLFSVYAAGVLLFLAAGAVPSLQFLVQGNYGAFVLLTAAAFLVPSLSLMIGTWTRHSRLFEIIYMISGILALSRKCTRSTL